MISRHGEDNYENLDRHADAQIAVNTTPVGMYPNTGVSPVDLHRLPRLEAALDVVYNPARTEFLLQAEARGLRRANGLLMLAAQAKKSCEDFTGKPVDDAKIFSITKALEAQMHNVKMCIRDRWYNACTLQKRGCGCVKIDTFPTKGDVHDVQQSVWNQTFSGGSYVLSPPAPTGGTNAENHIKKDR